ncbi:unnamed protein product [Caenorhabditis sp. 36 PRJEB53466]|nr:unnamed protein product [Caenorhabditis sp. 36 PRJEB53466]
MRHRSEKKKKRSENPKVSVRVSVRPLRANWKPVKQVECDGPVHTPSPAQDQLDSNVWKTKNVRTEYLEGKKIVVTESEPPTPDEWSEETEKSSECSCKQKMTGKTGLVARCDCPKCERADQTPTSMELSPKETIPAIQEEEEVAEKKKMEKKSETKVKRNKKTSIRRTKSMPPPPPPVPPNSVASRDSQRKWSKLYKEAHHPSKMIDLKKIPSIPGQIGMSELEPEEVVPQHEPLLPSSASFFHSSPQVLNPPPVSPLSISLRSFNNQPPLVPQLPVHVEPPNVQALPGDPLVVSKTLSTNPPTTTEPPPKAKLSGSRQSVKARVRKCSSNSSNCIVMVPPAPELHARTPIFRKMEELFYGQETSWWLLVALVTLSIFAYRSSIEQHTCYYD